jgi:hypothetical protein
MIILTILSAALPSLQEHVFGRVLGRSNVVFIFSDIVSLSVPYPRARC